MCGIAGIYNFNIISVAAARLEKILSHILHRGPDDSGTYLNQSVGLAHSRLSILDLSDAGHQPMIDKASGACLSYNGEIYNFKDIRSELKADGLSFNSTGDTEVLLKACIHWGVEKTLPKLNGMFAFALWDEKRAQLWLARDRMGIKPLYYFVEAGSVCFASEIKALLPVKSEVHPDMAVLFDILNGGTACDPYTVFADIRALNPGSYICLQAGKHEVVQREYFSIFDHVDEALYSEFYRATLPEMTEHFGKIMDDSIRIHSISDAPVATLLSGGVDSSLISALTSKYCEGMSLYHADVVGENSEMVYARQVADHLGLNFVTAQLTTESYIQNLVETTYFHETPSAYHPNDVPFQLISKRANEDGIKVFLTGEGADELFIGYTHASKNILRNKLRIWSTATPLVKTLASMIGKLYPWSEGCSMTERLSSRGVPGERLERARIVYDFVDSEIERVALVSSAVTQKAHLNSLLMRNDRMGMMHALESRIPFLENEMHRFAMNLPAKFKHPVSWAAILSGNPMSGNKIVVREAAKKYIPENITRRKKLGFPTTPEAYMKLDPGFFRDGFLEQCLGLSSRELQSVIVGVSGNEKWKLFSTELFGRMYFLNEDRGRLAGTIAGYART